MLEYHWITRTKRKEESSGPSTAEIIANQSQDYVDEKLAEYQATIQQLQSEYLFSEVYIFACLILPLIKIHDLTTIRIY
ncbi:hypothetical protein K0M31_004145 [Melipona bicolor]|uniref:Uncharacterized protein n=1 Tax=Melipona bicolor TaxID=60889 RepID=A0AA40FYK4_9HYME|nr:hypothetical protein K0M31_004145 [Melipona bicolor]